MKTIFIFGAGASYGAYPTSRNIAGTPLTAQLFSDLRLRNDSAKALGLINLLEQAREQEAENFDLEKALAALTRQATSNRLEELLDLRFAIQNLIRETSMSGFMQTPRANALD